MKLVDIFLAWVSGAAFVTSIFTLAVGNWVGTIICGGISIVCAICIGPDKREDDHD
jgi:hypothetical protein